MTVESASASPANGSLPPLKAVGVLTGLVVAIVGYLALAHSVGILATFAGMLFLFYWFACKAGAMDALPGALLGGLAGVLNGALFVLPGLDAGMSTLLGLIVLIVAIYFLLVGWAPLIVNQAYMLMVTVSTIPAIGAPPQHVGMAVAMTLAAIYFGAIVWALKMIGDRNLQKPA